jgi:hypothetical protein
MASIEAESTAGGANHGDQHDNMDQDSPHEEQQQPRPAAAPAEPPEPAEGEATMLVSEFPPPPYYYTRGENLVPPDIPTAALECGTRRAAAAAARARAEAERLRLSEHMMNNNEEEEDKTGAIFGGVVNNANLDDLKYEEGEVVAVFGEIVEDPVLIEPLDYCEDPKVVRDEVKRLNATVLREFVRLVQDLVHRPLEHK